MHPPNPEFTLPKLRRQLEEILAIVKADHNGAAFVQSAAEEPYVSVLENDASVAEPEIALAENATNPDNDLRADVARKRVNRMNGTISTMTRSWC